MKMFHTFWGISSTTCSQPWLRSTHILVTKAVPVTGLQEGNRAYYCWQPTSLILWLLLILAWISSWTRRSRIPFPLQMYDSDENTARLAAMQFLHWTHNTTWKHLLACTNASSASFWGCLDLLSLQTGCSRHPPQHKCNGMHCQFCKVTTPLIAHFSSFLDFFPLINLTGPVIAYSYHLNGKDWPPKFFLLEAASGPTALLLKISNNYADVVPKTW